MKRLLDLDIAIGLAIIVVVLGHLKFDGNSLEEYLKLKKIIYSFHMPLFMFFSGLLMSYTYKPLGNRKNYLNYIKKKVRKFIPAYLMFAIIFLVLETLVDGFSKNQFKEDLIYTFVCPSKAPAGFLWYIYVLFLFYLVLPFLEWMANQNILILVFISIIFQFIEVTHLFNLNLFSFYFLFITLGIFANKYLKLYYTIVSKFGFIFLLLFGMLICFYPNPNLNKQIMGLASIPTIHFLAILLTKTKFKDHFSMVGRHSFYIYLMNTLVMGILFIIINKYLKIKVSYFLLLFLFLSGVYLPIIIYKYLIKKTPLLNRIIL